MDAALTINAMFGVFLFIIALGIAYPDDSEEYARRVMRRRIWARAVLTSPLWIWWALFPALAVAAIVGLVVGARALWRMAFPGRAPTDGPTPSEGAYR